MRETYEMERSAQTRKDGRRRRAKERQSRDGDGRRRLGGKQRPTVPGAAPGNGRRQRTRTPDKVGDAERWEETQPDGGSRRPRKEMKGMLRGSLVPPTSVPSPLPFTFLSISLSTTRLPLLDTFRRQTSVLHISTHPPQDTINMEIQSLGTLPRRSETTSRTQ